MSTNRSSMEVPQELIDFTKTSLLELMHRWGAYAQTIDAGERESMAKMGLNRMPMAVAAHQYMVNHPNLVPSFIDVEGVGIDLANAQKLSPVQSMVEQFVVLLSDLGLVSRAEAYESCLSMYANVKLLAERESNTQARVVADDLGRHFKQHRKKKETAG